MLTITAALDQADLDGTKEVKLELSDGSEIFISTVDNAGHGFLRISNSAGRTVSDIDLAFFAAR